MERFVHNANIEHYRRMIAESEFDPPRDEDRHKMLLTLFPTTRSRAVSLLASAWISPSDA
jgi:hypothetical protein